MREKAEISKVLLKLGGFGWDVLSFGDKRPLRRGQGGFVDNLLVHEDKGTVYIETKTKATADKMTDRQREFARKLQKLASKTDLIKYYVITTLKEAIDLREQLINNRG